MGRRQRTRLCSARRRKPSKPEEGCLRTEHVMKHFSEHEPSYEAQPEVYLKDPCGECRKKNGTHRIIQRDWTQSRCVKPLPRNSECVCVWTTHLIA